MDLEAYNLYHSDLLAYEQHVIDCSMESARDEVVYDDQGTQSSGIGTVMMMDDEFKLVKQKLLSIAA